MEFNLGRKAYGKTGDKIHYFNQVARSAERANTNGSESLFWKDGNRETVRKTYRERKNRTATHIAAIQTKNHFRFSNVV